MTDDRRTRIGGSDVPKILGLCPPKWGSAVTLYLEKIGDAPPQDDTEKPWLEWGSKIEPLLLDKLAEEIGEPMERKVRVRHPTMDYFVGETDGLTPARVAEAKIDRFGLHWGESGTDDVPDHYAVQVQSYMLMTGRELAEFATLIGGSDFRRYTIAASVTVQRWIEEEVEEFWRRVQLRDPPDPRTEADCAALWRKSRSNTTVQAEPIIVEAWRERLDVAEQIKALEDRKSYLDFMLKFQLKDRSRLVGPEGQLMATWNTGDPVQYFDVDALRERSERVYNRFLKKRPGNRPLLVKKEKD